MQAIASFGERHSKSGRAANEWQISRPRLAVYACMFLVPKRCRFPPSSTHSLTQTLNAIILKMNKMLFIPCLAEL